MAKAEKERGTHATGPPFEGFLASPSVQEHANVGDSSPAGPQLPLSAMTGILTGEANLTKDDIARIEKFLRKTLQSPTISVRVRPRKTDSAEVYVGEEFIGVVYEDDEDDDKSFNFQMAILAEDLAG